MPMTCTIYAIRPIGGEVFYIGSTIKDAGERFRRHLADVRKRRHCNGLFASRCNRLGLDNLEVIELARTALGRRFDVEYKWIQRYLQRGVRLTNVLRSRRHAAAVARAKVPRSVAHQLARAIREVAEGFLLLTAFEYNHDQPLYDIRPKMIARLRERPEEYAAEAEVVETLFEHVLTLYRINTNGEHPPPLSHA